MAVVTSHSYLSTGKVFSSPTFDTIEYDLACRNFLFAIVTKFPADILTRTYAAIRGVQSAPFDAICTSDRTIVAPGLEEALNARI